MTDRPTILPGSVAGTALAGMALAGAAVAGAALTAACSSSGSPSSGSSAPPPATAPATAAPTAVPGRYDLVVVVPTSARATAGVTVTATRPSDTSVATTDPSGRATFHLPGGTYTISAGGCGGAHVVAVGGSQPLPVRVACPPP